MAEMVHRCGPGLCKNCRLKNAENTIARLMAKALRQRAMTERLVEALEHAVTHDELDYDYCDKCQDIAAVLTEYRKGV